jgi:DNA invertase Pin-like site-specific DNA recombinase
MAKGITASEMGKRGGTTRAKRYSKDQLRKWGKLGGRPAKLDRRAVARLRKLLASGTSQAESARLLDVSTRTVGRVIARMAVND